MIIRSLKSLSASPRMPSSGTTCPPWIMSMLGPLTGLEDVGTLVGEQRRGEGVVVVGGEPLDLDVGVLVGRGVALDRFLDALLAVPVVPLRQRRYVTAARATGRPRRGAGERRMAGTGDAAARRASQRRPGRCPPGDVAYSGRRDRIGRLGWLIESISLLPVVDLPVCGFRRKWPHTTTVGARQGRGGGVAGSDTSGGCIATSTACHSV